MEEPRLINTRYISVFELSILKGKMRDLWGRFKEEIPEYIYTPYWNYDTKVIILTFRIKASGYVFLKIIPRTEKECKWKLEIGIYERVSISGVDKNEDLINLIKKISEEN